MLLALHAAGLPEPVEEFAFDKCCSWSKRVHLHGSELPDGSPIHEYRNGRKWRFDFAWPAFMLAVECEGGTHSGGRHTRGSGFAADAEKYNAATLAGWSVLRFTGEQIDSGYAIEVVEQAIAQRSEAAS